jgi:hypothetical protein
LTVIQPETRLPHPQAGGGAKHLGRVKDQVNPPRQESNEARHFNLAFQLGMESSGD